MVTYVLCYLHSEKKELYIILLVNIVIRVSFGNYFALKVEIFKSLTNGINKHSKVAFKCNFS